MTFYCSTWQVVPHRIPIDCTGHFLELFPFLHELYDDSQVVVKPTVRFTLAVRKHVCEIVRKPSVGIDTRFLLADIDLRSED